jgi:hypothetical protein
MRETIAATDVCRTSMSARYTLMRLELALDEDPVSGLVGIAGDEPRSFIGYAGLVAALQSIRSAEPERSERSRPGADGVPPAAIEPEGSG